MRTLVFAYGRLNPPTQGHDLLVRKIKQVAKAKRADAVLVLSHSTGNKKNPLPLSEKLYFAKLAFPGIEMVTSSPECPNFLKYLGTVSDKYERVIMVAGSDRVPGHTTTLNQYNGKEYSFDKIEVVSAGERDPDGDAAENVSATKLRGFAEANNFEAFSKGLPLALMAEDSYRLFHAVRRGLRME